MAIDVRSIWRVWDGKVRVEEKKVRLRQCIRDEGSKLRLKCEREKGCNS